MKLSSSLKKDTVSVSLLHLMDTQKCFGSISVSSLFSASKEFCPTENTYLHKNSTSSYLFTFKGEILQKEASCCIRVVVLDNLVLSGDFLSHLIKEFTNMFTSVKVFEWMEADRLAWYAILLMLQTVLRLHGWSENTSFRHFCRRSILFETCKWYQDICVVSAADGLSSLWVKDNDQFDYEGQFICHLDKLEFYQISVEGRVA